MIYISVMVKDKLSDCMIVLSDLCASTRSWEESLGLGFDIGHYNKKRRKTSQRSDMVGHSDLKDGKLWLHAFSHHIIICISCTGNSEGWIRNMLNTHHSPISAIESQWWQRICGSGERSGPAQSRGKASRTYRCLSDTAGGNLSGWGTRGRQRTDPGSVRHTSLRHRPLRRGRSRGTTRHTHTKTWQKTGRNTTETAKS